MIKIGLTDFTPADKIIEIRDNKEVIKAKYAISATDILKCTLMNEHYIEISFQYNRYIAFKRSNYILWNGSKYTLREDYIPEQVNKRKYDYTLRFEAVEMLFQDIQYYYLNQSLKESEWRLAGNPEYFIKIAVDNANRYFKVTDFQIGVIEPTEVKDIIFDTNTNTFDALTQIAEAYESEWYMTGKTINLVKKVSFGAEVDFETEVSILSMSRSEGENSKRYTRILALGSERNLPKDYRGSSTGEGVDAVYPKRLRIPTAKGDVIDAYPNMSPDEVVEGTVIFDKIYPKRVGTIQAVGTIEYTDTDEDTGEVTKWNVFKIKDSGINFKEEYKLPEVELRLSFQSGDLNGFDFALKFHKDGFSKTDNSQYFEIARSEDYGKKLPNDTMKPKAGDKYVLYGFNIALVSDQYVPAGELELFDTASAWLQKQLQDTSVYDCSTVIDHFKKNEMDLELGQKVRLIKDVGGSRNLVGRFNGNNITTITENSISGYGFAVPNGGASRTFGRLKLKPNQEYVLTYTAWATSNINLSCDLYPDTLPQLDQAITTIPTKYTRVIKSAHADMANCSLRFWQFVLGATAYVTDIQLEEGNKASVWTPAPEDEVGMIRSSRVMGYEKKLVNSYDATYTVGDNSAYSRLTSIEKDLKELQYAGVVYENTGSGGVYLIKQFDTTTPSDFNAYSAKASDAKYFNKQTGGAIQGDTLFQKNMQVQGSAISDVFQNSTFTAGQLGSGFQIKRDANGQSYMEVDNLMVRRETVFNKLTIAEIKSVGGSILLSLANMVVSKVEDKTSAWRCYFDNLDGTVPNDFVLNDQVICRKFTGKNIKYYWSKVTSVGVDFIEISKTDKDGTGVPAVADEVIQLGNRSDVNRQYAIMLSAYGASAPSIKQYAGINSYDLTNKEVTAISPKGNKFTGSFIVSNNGTSKPVYKEEGLFVNGNTYYLNDRVSYLGSYWVCLVDKTVKVPNEESNDWRKDTIGQPDIDKVQKEYESQFLILDTNIASKVSKTDFDALGNRVSKTESSITQLSNSITSVVETVGKLPIIGRNLIIRHNELEKTMINTDGSVVTYYANSTMADPISVTGGEVLSFSKYGDFLPSDSNWRYAYYKEDGTLITRKGIGTDIFKEAVPSEAKFLRVSYPSKWKVKIERGNKVTEWSESPEDAAYKNRTYYQDTIPTVPSGGHIEGDLWYMKSLVDSSGNINADTSKNTYLMQYRWNGTTWQQVNWSVSKSKIEQTDNSISSIVEKTGIDSIGEGETLLSKIKQSESSIESIVQKTGVNGVSDGNTLLSMIKQTNDNITLEVSKIKIGATNLLLNSSFSNGVKPWSGQGTHAISVDTSVLFNNNNTLKIISTGDGNPSGATNRFLTLRDVAEGDHLFSFYAKADKPCTLRTRINNIIRDFAITTEWKRFVRPEAHRDDNIICWLTSSATMWLACPQIEAGNKVTDWRVSSDDIVDEIKAGIQIEADGISLFGEKFTVNSLLIAKAIETQALNVGGNTTINKDGTISICNGKILLNADGSGQLAGGNINWNKNGDLFINANLFMPYISMYFNATYYIDPIATPRLIATSDLFNTPWAALPTDIKYNGATLIIYNNNPTGTAAQEVSRRIGVSTGNNSDAIPFLCEIPEKGTGHYLQKNVLIKTQTFRRFDAIVKDGILRWIYYNAND